MTIQVTFKNDFPPPEIGEEIPKHKIVHLKIFDRHVPRTDVIVLGYDEPRPDVLVSEVWIEPGAQHQQHIWQTRYIVVSED